MFLIFEKDYEFVVVVNVRESVWVIGLSFFWDFDGKVLKFEDLRMEIGFLVIVCFVLEFFVFLFFELNFFGVVSEVF